MVTFISEYGLDFQSRGKTIEQGALFNAYKNKFPGYMRAKDRLKEYWKSWIKNKNKNDAK